MILQIGIIFIFIIISPPLFFNHSSNQEQIIYIGFIICLSNSFLEASDFR